MTEQDLWLSLVDEPIGAIVRELEAEDPGLREMISTPEKLLGIRAGLARQAAAAGWSYVDLIARVVEEALTRVHRTGGSGPTPPAALADARRLAEGMPYTQRLAAAVGRREPKGTRST